MRSIHLILAGALIMTGGAALAEKRLDAEAKLAKILDGRVAGAPVDCIRLRDIRSSEIVDRTAIVYRGNGNTLYVNRPSGAAFLNDDDILVSNTHSSDLCSIDILQLVSRTSRMPSGSVGLSQFIPYRKPAQ